MGMGCAICGLGWAGLGQDGATDSEGMPIDMPVDQSPIVTSPYNPGVLPVSGGSSYAQGPSLPSSSNSSLDNLLASLAGQWTKIAGQTIAPQTTIVGPNGLQVTTPAGQTSNLASILGGSSLVSGTGSVNFSAILPWLLIAGAGLFALKAVSK